MDIKIMEKETSSNECHHIRGLYHRNELSLTDRISYRWVFYPLDTQLLSTDFYSTSTCGLPVPAGSSLLSPSVHRPLTPVPQAFLGSTCEHTTRSPPADFHSCGPRTSAPCPSPQHLSLLGTLFLGLGLLAPSSLSLPQTRAAHYLETPAHPFHPESPSSFPPPAASITKTLHLSWTMLLTPPGNTHPPSSLPGASLAPMAWPDSAQMCQEISERDWS